MKKILLTILLVSLMTGLIFGCAKQQMDDKVHMSEKPQMENKQTSDSSEELAEIDEAIESIDSLDDDLLSDELDSLDSDLDIEI